MVPTLQFRIHLANKTVENEISMDHNDYGIPKEDTSAPTTVCCDPK